MSTMASMSSNTYPALTLTLRFPSSLPDLRLHTVLDPASTTALSLLPEIRHNLPSAQRTLRIILISGGRIVAPKEPLSTSLRLPTRRKLGKGKAKNHGSASEERENGEEEPLQWMIHATFSMPDSALSASELEAERQEGEELNAALRAAVSGTPSGASQWARNTAGVATTATDDAEIEIQRGLQGFDRLIATGIPESEVSALRTHFRSLVAAQNPDSAPLTPLEYLALEERWLDDAGPMGGDGEEDLLAGLSGGAGSGGSGSSSQIDDVLWGNVLGFFWPLGGLFWLSRQEDIWREGRALSVFVGVLVNFSFCMLRAGLVGGPG